MASSPQKSPSSPKSPTPKSPSSRKKDDSFLGKLGGTLARRKKAKEDTLKSSRELQEEQQVLQNLMRTVENRDQLVSLLEEQRLQERQQDQDLEGLVLSRGYRFHWGGPGDP